MESNTKKLVAVGVLLAATVGIAMAQSSGLSGKFYDSVVSKYPGYIVHEVPESGDVYLLVSKENIIIVSKSENIIGKIKIREVISIPNVK